MMITYIQTKIVYKSFSIKTLCLLKLKNDGDEVGLEFMGNEYAYISVKRINGNNHIQLKSGAFNQENDIVLEDYIYNRDSIEFINIGNKDNGDVISNISS